MFVAILGLAMSGPASAAPSTQARIGGIVPVVGRGYATTANNLQYGGGLVMRSTSVNYLIFWEPPALQTGTPATVSPKYNSLLKRYFHDVGGTGLYNNNTQYYQVAHGTQQHIVNRSSLGGVFVDTSAYPIGGACSDPVTPGNCLDDSQIQAEVTHAMNVKGWKASSTHMFYVFTSKGEGSCVDGGLCAFSYYCAYHGAFGKVIYANMPYGATPVPGNAVACTTLNKFPNDHDADIEISITSHEHMEAVTDPYLNAWQDSSGQEIGDKCAYKYGPMNYDQGAANEQWNGHFYAVQQEWDNHTSGCVQSGP
jgi:hypothetical protein